MAVPSPQLNFGLLIDWMPVYAFSFVIAQFTSLGVGAEVGVEVGMEVGLVDGAFVGLLVGDMDTGAAVVGGGLVGFDVGVSVG